MTIPRAPFEIPESERTPLVEWLLNIIEQQQQVIEQQQETIGVLGAKVAQLEEQVGHLDEQLKASKKLKGKPKISPSKLNQEAQPKDNRGKRAATTDLPKLAHPSNSKTSLRTDSLGIRVGKFRQGFCRGFRQTQQEDELGGG